MLLVVCVIFASVGCGLGGDSVGVVPAAAGSPAGGVGGPSAPAVDPGSPTRELTLRWLPSASSGVTRYDLSIGQASGAYTSTLRIPVDQALRSQDGVYSHVITLQSDVDYYMSLRAFDGREVSSFSNEILVSAVSAAQGGGGGGSGSGSQPSSALGGGSSASAVASDGNAASVAAPAARGVRVQNTSRDQSGSEPAPPLAPPLASDGSIEFDGAAEYLASLSENPLGIDGSFTLSMWLRPFLDDVPRRVLLDARPADGSEANRITLVLLQGENLEFTIHGSTGAVAYRGVFELALVDDAWQHLAVVLDTAVGIEPRVFIDLGSCPLLASDWNGSAISLVETSVLLYFGGASVADEAGFVGRLGHIALWAGVLPQPELAEIQGRGHQIDLRSPLAAYESTETLLHYWRLGDDSNPIGYDLGPSGSPIDLDDLAGGIDRDDIVIDAPASILERVAIR